MDEAAEMGEDDQKEVETNILKLKELEYLSHIP